MKYLKENYLGFVECSTHSRQVCALCIHRIIYTSEIIPLCFSGSLCRGVTIEIFAFQKMPPVGRKLMANLARSSS